MNAFFCGGSHRQFLLQKIHAQCNGSLRFLVPTLANVP